MGQVLIDGQLVFDEDNFLLFRVDTPDEEPLRLGAIASRCLAILLRSGGTVVRKRELMAWAWGQYDLEVTDNSLAQVIRQLRLALEKLQPDREFIQTLPRIGYKIADSVRVQELPIVSKASPITAASAAGSEGPIPASPPPTRVDIAGDDAQSPSIDTAKEPSPMSPVISARRWGLWLTLPLWGSLAFLLGKFWMPPTSDVSIPMFAAPVTMNDVQVHPLLADSQTLVPSLLQPKVVNSQKLAARLGMSSDDLHLYLMPGRRGADQILCEGELEAAGSRCIGVQQHD
ncbi:winged helix-turn-helix domain-containing protein [Pseudomonas baetica]|uniref:winged helix-turn-helix domain-containing protein n=1 Tax=Pseudomonas baetica TaxID=674054 RepID=UPI003EF04A26